MRGLPLREVARRAGCGQACAVEAVEAMSIKKVGMAPAKGRESRRVYLYEPGAVAKVKEYASRRRTYQERGDCCR